MAYQMNPQRRKASEEFGKKPPEPKPMGEKTPKPEGEKEPMESGNSTTLHDHGDGTFHTEGSDGEKTEHPHIGHALVHMGAKHAGGMHMHHHSEGSGHTSHHHDGVTASGPHESPDTDSLKEHVGDVMGGDDSEGSGEPMPPGMDESMSAPTGL